MRRFFRKSAVAFLIALCSGHAYAVPVESPTEAVTVLAEYVEKISKVSYYVDTIQESANYVKSVGKEGFNAAVDGLVSLSGDLTDSFQETLHFSDLTSFVKNINTLSPEEKTEKIQQNYGIPQENKEAAERYVRTTFFYSTKEGDKYEGQELPQRDIAFLEVMQNRKGYQLEVIATSYATAVENRTKGYEEAMKRYEHVKQKAHSAESSDDKKAAEALITQEETRQRINRLALELAMLERDVVEDILMEPADILIARTVDQIKSETEAELKDVDLEEPVGDTEDGATGDGDNGKENPYLIKNGGQS